MSKLVNELSIISKDVNKNIFDTDEEYVIPLYQRAYAWKEKQLWQLIEDIQDVADDAKYYIGSLVVSKQAGRYEVVDGQQRLTSLYLLLNCLGIETKNTLTFACREKSNYTLRNIKALLENDSKIDTDRIENCIHRGVKILEQEVLKKDFKKEDFIEKLKRVVIYRIEVPENTDLNRYFEIMNTRGEQLEQHDILKANLMGGFEDNNDGIAKKEKELFAKIWDACCDMTGYVQMHFSTKNELRENIFKDAWETIPANKWVEYENVMKSNDEGTGLSLEKIIKGDFKIDESDGYVDGDNRVRFESVIEFPYFLLHTLKVYVEVNGIKHCDENKKIVDELLDDKKLIEAFDRVVNYGKTLDNKKIIDDKEAFAKGFIICLLRTRYLYDKYIIKREYVNDSADGEWSLKELKTTVPNSGANKGNHKTAYYINTKFNNSDENNDKVKSNLMLQSALRVSYTSPKVMHWITKLLTWLYKNVDSAIRSDEYLKITEQVACKAVQNNFFDECKDGLYEMGVNTPHIVFNYLDYLLWEKDRNGENKYKDFTFEFRNSVEHWYPQNPSEGSFEKWDKGKEVDGFGNLCIIQRNVNAKFSNLAPDAKKSTYEERVGKGSIKLRIMSELTKEGAGMKASVYWKDVMCKIHEEEMIGYLKEACNKNQEE